MMNDTFMKEKPVLPLILSMTLPMVLSMLVNSLYNIIDSFFVAQISEEAMMALSLVYPVQNFIMSADPRTVDGAVYPHKSGDSGRRNRLTHHRGRVYRLGGFCYIFRSIGGTWERNSLLTDFPLPVCSGHHPSCFFTQQVFRSGWRLECVLDHGSDYCDHFPCHLPQGNHSKN